MHSGIKVFIVCIVLILSIGVYLTIKKEKIVGWVDGEAAPNYFEEFSGWQVILMALVLIPMVIFVIRKTRDK